MPTTVITPTSTTTTTSQRQPQPQQQQQQHQPQPQLQQQQQQQQTQSQQQQQPQQQPHLNGPPHYVDLHVNAGECVSLQLSDGQEQVVAGPATITMISQQQNPPVPIPVQVPPGHMIHQIADENGTLKHIILSIMDSDENAQLNSTVITLPQGTFRVDSNGELVSTSAPITGETGAPTLTTLPQQAYIANYDGCPVAYDATTMQDSAPEMVTPAWYYYHAAMMAGGGNYSPKYSNYNQHVPTTLAPVASTNKQIIHGGNNQVPPHLQQQQQSISTTTSYRNPESDNYLQRTREVSYSQHATNNSSSYGSNNNNVRSKHNDNNKRQTSADKTSNHQQHNRYATSNVKVIDNDHLAIQQSQGSNNNNLSSQSAGSVSPLRSRIKGSSIGTNSNSNNNNNSNTTASPSNMNHQHHHHNHNHNHNQHHHHHQQHQHHHHNQQNGHHSHHYINSLHQQHDTKENNLATNHISNNYHGPLRQQDAISNPNYIRSSSKSTIPSYEQQPATTSRHINNIAASVSQAPLEGHQNQATSNTTTTTTSTSNTNTNSIKGTAWQSGKFNQHKQSNSSNSDIAQSAVDEIDQQVHVRQHVNNRMRESKDVTKVVREVTSRSGQEEPVASLLRNKRDHIEEASVSVNSEQQPKDIKQAKQKTRHNSNRNHSQSGNQLSGDNHDNSNQAKNAITDNDKAGNKTPQLSSTSELATGASNVSGLSSNKSVSNMRTIPTDEDAELNNSSKHLRGKGESKDLAGDRDVASGETSGDKRLLVKETANTNSSDLRATSSSRSSSSSNSSRNSSNSTNNTNTSIRNTSRTKQKMCQSPAKNQQRQIQSTAIDHQLVISHDNQVLENSGTEDITTNATINTTTKTDTSASSSSSQVSAYIGSPKVIGETNQRVVTCENQEKATRTTLATVRSTSLTGQSHKNESKIKVSRETSEKQGKKDNHSAHHVTSNSNAISKPHGSLPPDQLVVKRKANEKRRDSNAKIEQQQTRSKLSSINNTASNNLTGVYSSNHSHHRGNTSSSHSNSNCSNSKPSPSHHQQPFRFSSLLRQCRAKFVVLIGNMVRNSLSSYSDAKFAGLLLVLFTVFAMLLAIFIHLYIVAPVTE